MNEIRKMRDTFSILILVIILSAGCKQVDTGAAKVFEKNGFVYFENKNIRLRINDRMFVKVSYHADDQYLSLNDTSGLPSHCIILNGRLYAAFERTGYKVEVINDPLLGPGKKLTLTGSLTGIVKTLTFDMYDRFPDVALSECSYTNNTDSVQVIDSILYEYYSLNRKLTAPEEASNSFHYLQPLSRDWGNTWTNLVVSDTTDEHFSIPGTGINRSGIPFIDVWGAELGMAIFHVEGTPRFLQIRLMTREDQKVNVGMITVPALTYGQFPGSIAPGISVTTWKSAVCLHQGDFFNGARRFGQLLDAALQKENKKGFIKDYPPQAYDPYWKTWGMNDLHGSRKFTVDQVRSRMHELADSGFGAIMLDAGWQNSLGLWDPDPGKFQDEQDMIDFVKEAHTGKWGHTQDKSFKVYLWFDLLGTDTITREIEPLPVRNKDGSFYKSDQAQYAFCPQYRGTHAYLEKIVGKIIGRWGVDGLYTDLMDQNPPPCFAENHDHQDPFESVEKNFSAFKLLYERIMEIKPETGWISQCACAAVHDVYQYPYYQFEDASDPTSNEQVRWRVRWMKAIRGPAAPVGDGYVDKMNYDKKAGEPAQSVAIGSVITSVRWETGELGGREHARRWMDLYASEKISSGEYLGLYDIAYESPEAHVIRQADGTMYYSFFSDTAFDKTVYLKGLEKALQYKVLQYEDSIELGRVSAGKPEIHVASKKGNDQGDPVYYYVIKCTPVR